VRVTIQIESLTEGFCGVIESEGFFVVRYPSCLDQIKANKLLELSEYSLGVSWNINVHQRNDHEDLRNIYHAPHSKH
jgi:hypothetical protein